MKAMRETITQGDCGQFCFHTDNTRRQKLSKQEPASSQRVYTGVGAHTGQQHLGSIFSTIQELEKGRAAKLHLSLRFKTTRRKRHTD